MKIYVAGDPVDSESRAIKLAVQWWASAMGTQPPDFTEIGRITSEVREFIADVIDVRTEPGDGYTESDARRYQRTLVRRAMEFLREVYRKAHEDLVSRELIGYSVYGPGARWYEPNWLFDVRTRDRAIWAAKKLHNGVPLEQVENVLRKSGEPMLIEHEAPEAEGPGRVRSFGNYFVVPIYNRPPKDWRYWFDWDYDEEDE